MGQRQILIVYLLCVEHQGRKEEQDTGLVLAEERATEQPIITPCDVGSDGTMRYVLSYRGRWLSAPMAGWGVSGKASWRKSHLTRLLRMKENWPREQDRRGCFR